jgi:hypothetical protein
MMLSCHHSVLCCARGEQGKIDTMARVAVLRECHKSVIRVLQACHKDDGTSA